MQSRSKEETLTRLFGPSPGDKSRTSWQSNTRTYSDSWASSSSYCTDSDSGTDEETSVAPCDVKPPTPKCPDSDPPACKPKRKCPKRNPVVHHGGSSFGPLGVVIIFIILLIVLFFVFSMPSVSGWFDTRFGASSALARAVAFGITLILLLLLLSLLFWGCKGVK